MRNLSLKKAMACILAITLTMATFVGCSDTASKPSDTSSPSSVDAPAPVEKTKVLFWYLWGSASAVKNIDGLVKSYNDASDKYIVEALSVPDAQKIMAAISAGNGPDITDEFGSNVGKLAATGIMEPLDKYITDTKYDIEDFVPAALESCKMNGITYALPLNINLSALYYNKTLLKEAGYAEPPKTIEEMYEMAVKTTTSNADGSINVCGFPDFPVVYYLDAFAYAAGGGWYTKDGKASPVDDFGNKYALKLSRDFRQKFGIDNVVKFSTGGKYLDPTDPFLTGKQTFRIDGPWMGQSIKEEFKSDVDYGVTYVPYPKDKPELAARTNASCSMMFIPSNAKNKEGAFDFLRTFVGKEGQEKFTIPGGDFPCRVSMFTNEQFKKGYDTEFYSELAKSKNLITIPAGPMNGEYNTLVKDQTELCMNLKQDIETTMKNIYEQGSALLK